MGKRSIIWIISLSSTLLMGFVITQYLWISRSLEIRDDTFYHSNRIALRSAMNSVKAKTESGDFKRIPADLREKPSTEISDYILLCDFDLIMTNEFCYYDLHKDYEYGILDHLRGKIYHNSYKGLDYTEMIKSRFTWSLEPVLRTDRYSLLIWFPNEKKMITKEMTIWVLLVSAFLLGGLILTYILTIGRLINQKRFSDIKTDFINNMTHEFKTPISTISAASEMMIKNRSRLNDEMIDKYSNIIYDENQRLQQQVEQVIQISVLEKGDYDFKARKFDLHKVISRSVDVFRLVIRDAGGVIETQLNADESQLIGDEIHITNVINNLLDNAIKYSKEKPNIVIETKNRSNIGIEIFVIDKGIGISPEHVEQIFNRLYRIPTGNRHDVKGSGIGLYYAKKVLGAHQGTIKVESELGKGSKFVVFIPFLNETSNVDAQE